MTVCDLYRVLCENQIVHIYQRSLSIYKGHAIGIPIGLMDITIKQISTSYNTNRILIELND
jgi:hypothetical protein